MDKWAALGDRRRAYHPNSNKTKESAPITFVPKRDSGLGFTVYDSGVWEKHARPRIHNVSDDVEELEWVGGWHDLHL
jgi:hypothetical protein